MASSEKNIKELTIIYDSLNEQITEISNNDRKINDLITVIKEITNKNASVLYTNIVGAPILINDQDKTKVMSAIGLKIQDVEKICKSTPRLNGIGQILGQFAFAAPILLLAGKLHLKKIEKYEKIAQWIFLFTYFRPYASGVTRFWTLGKSDEQAMDYTVQVELNDKSYIHKYGTVYNTLVESARTAYDTYIDILSGTPDKPTDDKLYNNIFYSAIFCKTKSWLKSLYGAYKNVIKTGKSIGYQQEFFGSVDKDTENTEYAENNITSDSAAKRAYVSKAITRFNVSPVNMTHIQTAARMGFKGNTSQLYESYLIEAVENIAESRSSLIPLYFDSIVGAFLNSRDDSGRRHTPTDIPTYAFLAYCKRNFMISHTVDSNVKNLQNMTEQFLLDCSTKYCASGSVQKSQMKYTLLYYFAIFIQKA